MGADFLAEAVERLESNDLLASERAGVELEGHVHGAAGVIRREGGLGGDGLAVDLEGLAGLLVHQLALDRVLLAGDEPGVGDGIHDDGLGVDDRVMVAVDAVLGGGADAGLGEFDGLALVVDVGVGADLGTATVERLEDDHALTVEVSGIEGEGHIHGAVGAIRGELRLGDILLAVLIEQGVARGLEHQLALDRVLLAGHEALVGDGVDDDGLGVGGAVLVAINAVLGGGADGGLGELDGLALVVDVGVGSQLLIATVERLEGHHALALEGAAVEGEGDVHGAGGVGGGELRLGGDGLAVLVLQGLAGGFHHKLALDRVLAARHEVLVGDRVDDDGLGVDDRLLVAIDAVLGGGADAGLEDTERLLGVVKVLVLADGVPVASQLLEDDDLLARVAEQVDGDLHLHGAGLTGGREALLHGATDDVTGLLVDERGAHGVRLAGHKAGELDVIGDDGLLIGEDQLVAIHAVARARVDVRLGLKAVVDGAEVDRH